MIQNFSKSPRVMEFTSFKKKEDVTEDSLLQAILKFEQKFLANHEGVLFHCLVRNRDNEYANVLFADNMETMQAMFKGVQESPEAQAFFSLIEQESVVMNFNQIQKDNFQIPEHFTCVEFGTFSLQSPMPVQELISISNEIEDQYLNATENTQGHFIGVLSETLYSEVTFGKTLAKTKEICQGYVDNTYCNALLNAADSESMKLDFWILVA